jgi:thioredoxin 1
MRELSENEFDSVTQNNTVLVDFSAEWCGPCKAMLPVLNRIAGEYQGKMEVFSVDIDQSPMLAARHGVMSVPTLLFFKDGKPVDRIIGAVSEKDLKRKIDAHLES